MFACCFVLCLFLKKVCLMYLLLLLSFCRVYFFVSVVLFFGSFVFDRCSIIHILLCVPTFLCLCLCVYVFGRCVLLSRCFLV